MREADFLEQALDLARTSATTDGGPFGAVAVRDGEVLASGTNQVTASPDPTAHAEVVALRRASWALGTHLLDGVVLYSSCEPCPMCLTAGMWARVDRIVYAADRVDAASAGFDDEEFYALFSTPREQWTDLVVEQLPLETATLPFDAWLANADRVGY
jgi:tRNA(Arg) A34 adenosine deaminase TadA